jgi:hypothetical protein
MVARCGDFVILHLVLVEIWGGITASENRALILVMGGNWGVIACYLFEGITVAAIVYSLLVLRGNPRSGSPE